MKNQKTNWYLIETEQDYVAAMTRYEEVKCAVKGTVEHKEKLLLAHLIPDFEEKTSELPEVDPVELIKIRMEDSVIRRRDKVQMIRHQAPAIQA